MHSPKCYSFHYLTHLWTSHQQKKPQPYPLFLPEKTTSTHDLPISIVCDTRKGEPHKKCIVNSTPSSLYVYAAIITLSGVLRTMRRFTLGSMRIIWRSFTCVLPECISYTRKSVTRPRNCRCTYILRFTNNQIQTWLQRLKKHVNGNAWANNGTAFLWAAITYVRVNSPSGTECGNINAIGGDKNSSMRQAEAGTYWTSLTSTADKTRNV